MAYDPRRIIRLRELRHWSQRDLAEKARLPQSRISEFESGTKPTKVEHVEALADALDCTVGFLLGREYKHIPIDKIEKAASKMAFKAFAEREGTTDGRRSRCRRVLGHEAAPVTADGWTALAEHIDLAVPPASDDRRLRAVND